MEPQLISRKAIKKILKKNYFANDNYFNKSFNSVVDTFKINLIPIIIILAAIVILIHLYFDNKKNKGELILNYYQPTAEQSVFVLKKIINYNTSEVKYITQNYKCSCKSMSHINKKISTDKKFTIEEELKFCNCFINKNKIEPFRIEESVLIDRLNLYKYVVFEVLSYYTDNYCGNYDEENEFEEDEEYDEDDEEEDDD